MRLMLRISELWRALSRGHSQKAPLTMEDHLQEDSIKSRPGEASEIVLLEECFGMNRDFTAKPGKARRIA